LIPCKTVKELFGLSVAMTKKGTWTIGERGVGFKGMVNARTFVIVPVSKADPKGFNPDVQGLPVYYDGHKLTIHL
jgi:alpha-D-xyloside xylohydrolase